MPPKGLPEGCRTCDSMVEWGPYQTNARPSGLTSEPGFKTPFQEFSPKNLGEHPMMSPAQI